MEWAGIDPGINGGLAFHDDPTLIVYPAPIISTPFVKAGKRRTRNVMDLTEAARRLRKHSPRRAMIERVSAGRGQGVTGMFRFGENFGQWQGMLAALGIETHFVSPQVWKRYFGLTKEKDASLELARVIFEENAGDFRLKKHDGLAEASLIARYAHLTFES